VDCTYIGRRLHGFKPQWTARRGIEQLYHTFRATGLALGDFEGERFKRIAHVQKLIQDGELDTDLRRTPQLAIAV
ncbi:MAG: NAD-dependent dehydratase, partial [Mesorhizobium sp.]